MLEVSEAFHHAFKSNDREVLARVIINGISYPRSIVKSIEYSMGAFGGESFQIGSTQSATIKVVFSEVIEDLKELDEIQIEIGIKIGSKDLPANIKNVSEVGRAKVNQARLIAYIPDRYEFVPLGTFYISQRVDPDRNENTTTIEGRDGFIFMESEYLPELDSLSSLTTVALDIAKQSNVAIDEETFAHLNNYRITKPEGYSYRQAIGLIAQYQVGFASFNRIGKLTIRKLIDPKFTINPNEYFLKGLTKNELLYQPKGLTCKVVQKNDESSETNTLQSGSPNGAQIHLENNTMTQALLDVLFAQVKTINYYPIQLKWRGNPALEVGDWVTMTDRKKTVFKVPVLNYTLNFDGGLNGTISANSKAYSGGISSFRGPWNQKLDELDYRIDAAGKNNVYSGTEEPLKPRDGDIWFKKNGPDDEIWVYQQVSDGVFDWVMTTSTRMPEEIRNQIESATPKDEIVKTINLSSEMNGKEWLKIKGAKLWLTNETKIDNAVITSAMIAEVNAGKIQAGTLDASKITVTNLNAEAISTGIATGKNLSINFDTGQVYFTKGKIEGPNISLDISSGKFTSSGLASSSRVTVTISEGQILFSDILQPNDSKYSASITGWGLTDSEEGTIYPHIQIGAYNGIRLYCRKGMNRNEISLDTQLGLQVWAKSVDYRIKGNYTIQAFNFNVTGSKNAIHLTRDGVRATPAYETAESYLGDIGRGYTKDDCSTWVPIDMLFSDTVNTDIPYEVFLQAYDNDFVWVSAFKSDAFLVCSEKPNTRFAWEIKAKRLGYENERLEIQEFDNKKIEETWRINNGN